MPERIKRELLAIADALDGLLGWEQELSGGGFPAVEVEPLRRPSAPSPDPGELAVHSGDAAPPPTERAPVGVPSGSSPRASTTHPPRDTSVQRAPAVSSTPTLQVLQAEAASCTACGLHAGRTRSVFARGNPSAEIVFVGEGPGYHEDQQGEPFVGPAGQLLDKMIVAMGYTRDEVYVCNVVKCRPPENRTPLAAEADACAPFLRGQLANVQPQAIVALGKCATEALGCMTEGQKRWRGVWSEYAGVPVMPTYHPAFLLRSPQFKRHVWDDLKLVMARVGQRGVPGGGS